MAYIILSGILFFLLVVSLSNQKIYLYSVSGLLILINLAYLILYDENLHCDQHTSFMIAFFDFDRHPEEIPEPLVYNPILGTLIRLAYGSILIAICFLPTILILKNLRGFKLIKITIPIILVGVVSALAIYIPNRIIGERISAFVGVAGFINFFLLISILAFYVLGTLLKRIKTIA